MYLQGDKVRYVGNKFRAEIGAKRGEVVSQVRNQPSAVVVDFGGEYCYVCSVNSVMPVNVSPNPNDVQEVEVVSRKRYNIEGDE